MQNRIIQLKSDHAKEIHFETEFDFFHNKFFQRLCILHLHLGDDSKLPTRNSKKPSFLIQLTNFMDNFKESVPKVL